MVSTVQRLICLWVALASLFSIAFHKPPLVAAQSSDRIVERTVVVRATAGQDTYIDEASATSNFSTQEELRAGPIIAKTTPANHSLFQMNLPALPAGATLVQAELDIYYKAKGVIDQSNVNFHTSQIYGYRITQPSWDPRRATWNTYDGSRAWQTPGGDYDTGSQVTFDTLPVTGKDPHRRSANITTLAKDALSARQGKLNILVTAFNEIRLGSSRFGDGSYAPTVQLTYTLPFGFPESCNAVGAKMDVMVALDRSRSMRPRIAGPGSPTRLEEAKNAIRDMATVFERANQDAASERIKVGLTTFALSSRLNAGFTSNFNDFRSKVNAVGFPDDTNTVLGDGIETAAQELLGANARTGAKKVLIILSDGREVGSDTDPVIKADKAKVSGVEIFSVAIGDQAMMQLLYSGLRGTHYYFDSSGASLKKFFEAIIRVISDPCEPSLKFCARDITDATANPANKRPVVGAHIDIEDRFIRGGLRPPDNKDYLITGADGCTNPTFLDYPVLSPFANQDQTLTATHANYQPANRLWQLRKDDFTEQVVYIYMSPKNAADALKFCVYDQQSNAVISGAQVRPNQPTNDLIRSGLSAPDNQGYLITGPDGCTNPDFIDKTKLQNTPDYLANGVAVGYRSQDKNWKWLGGYQQVDLYLTQSVGLTTTVTKTASPDVLVGSQKNTRITVTFQVVAGFGQTVTNVVVREKLNSTFQLAANPNVSISSGSIDRVTRINAQAIDIYLAGTYRAGTYQVSFDVVYNGGTGTGIAIDRVDTTLPDECARLTQVAHIGYTVGSSVEQCRQIDAGSIDVRPPRLLLLNDAWIGNKEVRVGDSLQVGRNSLIVAGREVSGSGFIGVPNYNIPSTGKLAWERIINLMNQRIDAATASGIQTWNCPAGVLDGPLYLNGVTSPLDSTVVSGRKIWKLENCNVALGNVTFYGTGTIINKGGTLRLAGVIKPESTAPDNTLGYISLGGGVTLDSGAQVENTAIFTSGQITIAPNTTDTNHINTVKLIGRSIQFPRSTALKSDIELRNSSALATNPPPLFDQPFDRPQGQEVP